MEQLLLAVEMTGAYHVYHVYRRARPDSERVRANFAQAYLHDRMVYRAALERIYPLGQRYAKGLN